LSESLPRQRVRTPTPFQTLKWLTRNVRLVPFAVVSTCMAMAALEQCKIVAKWLRRRQHNVPVYPAVYPQSVYFCVWSCIHTIMLSAQNPCSSAIDPLVLLLYNSSWQLYFHALHREGQRFEPVTAHHKTREKPQFFTISKGKVAKRLRSVHPPCIPRVWVERRRDS
jgi:hypothetical protein